MTVVRRLTEGDGAQLLEDPVLQKLTVAVRRDVVAFLADLLDSSRPDRGAGVMAFNVSINYPAGTVGARLKAILTGIGEGQPWADVDALVADLAGRLGETALDPSIVQLLELIDQPGTGLLARLGSLEDVYGDTVAAGASAAAAALSAGDAAAAEAAALDASNQAAVKAGEALQSVTDTQTAKLAAETAAGAASTSATSAASSATSASGSASTATTQAGLAASSASTAAGAATAAAESATSASSSSTDAGAAATAANTSKLAAETAQSSASTSATSAASSATSASGSASTASTKASDAATSAAQAQGSADAASTSATNAATSATNAGTSASAASTSANTASTKAAEAATHSTDAATASTNASGSAASASGYASAAATAETNAGASASAAVSSASNASAAAENAAGSASAAATHYNNTVAATGTLAGSVESLSQAIAGPNGVTAQHVLKVGATRGDGRKVFAAIGLAATAPTDTTAGQSDIILQSDRLLFVPPGAPDADPVQMMEVGVVNGVTTLRVAAARIGDLTVDTIKIVDGAVRAMGAAELGTEREVNGSADLCNVVVNSGNTPVWVHIAWLLFNSSAATRFAQVQLVIGETVIFQQFPALDAGRVMSGTIVKFIAAPGFGSLEYKLRATCLTTANSGLLALGGVNSLFVIGSKR